MNPRGLQQVSLNKLSIDREKQVSNIRIQNNHISNDYIKTSRDIMLNYTDEHNKNNLHSSQTYQAESIFNTTLETDSPRLL